MVNIVIVASYLCNSDLSKERAEWEERDGGTAPPQRPQKEQVAIIAVIVTAVFAFQLLFLDKWQVGIWGAICEGLVISLAFFTAKETEAHTCSRDVGSILEERGEDGQVPAFIELVVKDARVFANCKSWKIKYHAKKNDIFMPLCTPKHYNGYDMIPVFGGGAIQADLLRPCPAAVVTSSVHCHVHGMCMHISYAAQFNANQTNIESDKC